MSAFFSLLSARALKLLVIVIGIGSAVAVGFYAYFVYDLHTRSLVFIRNYSGSTIRFEKVMIGREVVWSGPAVNIDSKPATKPWLSASGVGPAPFFRAEKDTVELRITAAVGDKESRTYSCLLDNRSRPCVFEVFYVENGITCSSCDSDTLLD